MQRVQSDLDGDPHLGASGLTMALAPAASTATATQVAAVARLVAASGLAEAFGHVSARLESGGFAITSTGPLGAATEQSLLAIDDAEVAAERRDGQPLETPAHAAIYDARPDVGAIVRCHPPSVTIVGLGTDLPPVTHGLAGLAGTLALHEDPQLLDGPERAASAAAALGEADCLIMRANGALTVGPDLSTAAVRAWFLEERARVWLTAGRSAGLDPAELEERAEHWQAETQRAWAWLQWRFGDGGSV